MRQEERAQGVNAKQNWQTNSLIKHATNLPWELTEESTQKPYKASTYDAGRALLGIPSSYPPSYRSDENTKHNKEQSPRALHRPLDDDSWDNLWKHESLTGSGSDFDFDTAISYPRIEENKLSRKGIPLVSHYNYYSPPAASIASPYSTSIGSTYPTSLASTYLTTPNSSVQTSADKPAQVARALWPPNKLNNYLGLCKGAWKVQSGFRGFKFYSEPGPGCYTITSALRCVECAFEGPLPLDLSREHPKFEDNVRTHKASGVRYRFEFLAKSHVPYRRDAASHIAPDSPRGAFCCMLCCVAHGSMQIYEDLDIFMAHLAEQHWDIGRDTLAVLPGIRCVVSRVAPDSEEFDLNIPPDSRLS
ncbi:hypothetical protein PENCOP_c013G04029 [Penicillium coprophilum]|uniref:Uncharacterized protein n=1 Tax=Penicillium coprophilum TaxID=36646 RepID=A0A1V6UAK7_9EURO|nr:hypothetical protein PENCOP_c013G04029 [Penicillium coprophilum]